jgi:hypothetical protein
MRFATRAALLSLVLAGCAAAPPGNSPQTPSPVSVIGTPFLIALKIPFCIATVAVAGPVAAVAQIADPWPPVSALYGSGDPYRDVRRGLDDGIARNCGPPYAITP